jgi:hypothetical protein
MNKLMRKLGFSLIEVILGSVIIAGFVSTTVYTAGEIGMARRASLASNDKNTWATLQTQFAAEGVKAPSSISAVWGNAGDFGALHAEGGTGGSLDFDSTGQDLDANTVSTKGVIGQSISVNAFRVNVSSAGVRENINTVGLALMDRSNYSKSGASTGNNATQGVTDPVADPMDKPTGLFDLNTVIAIAKYVPSATSTNTYTVVPSSTVSLNALSDINWSTGSTAFYILLKATSGTISNASCSINLTSISSSNSVSFGGYSYVFPVTLDTINSLGTTSLGITTTSTNSAGKPVVATGSVTISQITPAILHKRVLVTSGSVTSTETTSSNVDIFDVAQSAKKDYYVMRTYVTQLNGINIATLLASGTLGTNASAILSHMNLYDYVDSYDGAGAKSSSPLYGAPATTGSYTFPVSVGNFSTSGTSFKWRTSTRSDTLGSSTPYSVLIKDIDNPSVLGTTTLTIKTTPLPTVTYDPASGLITLTSVKVSATISLISPICPILGDLSEDAKIYSLYYNYTLNGSIPAPPTTSSTPVVAPIGSNISFTGMTENATANVSASALATTYSLFLTQQNSSATYFTYKPEDDEEATTVMKVNYISNNAQAYGGGHLNGYVEGSIRVMKEAGCNFHCNGSFSLGLKLLLPGEPMVQVDNIKKNYKVYQYPDDPGAFTAGYCWIALDTQGTYYKAHNNTKIPYTVGNISGVNGNTIVAPNGHSSYCLSVDSIKSADKMIIKTGYDTGDITIAKDCKATTSNGEVYLRGSTSGSVDFSSSTSVYDKYTTLKLAPGTYNYTFAFENSNAVLQLTSGEYHIYGLKFNSACKIQTTGDVVLYVRNLSSNNLGNGSPTITLNSDGSLKSATGGSIIGSVAHPVTLHLTSTSATSTTVSGQFYGTIYSNGFVKLDSCMVMGRVESNELMQNNGYMFIKNW